MCVCVFFVGMGSQSCDDVHICVRTDRPINITNVASYSSYGRVATKAWNPENSVIVAVDVEHVLFSEM